MTNLILIRGIPGSGKSTLAKMLQNELWKVGEQCMRFEADMYFENFVKGTYDFDATKLRQAHMWCQENTRQSLSRGDTVIVSNTFTTLKEMKPYVDMIRAHGKEPTILLCQSNWGSIHDVPEETIEAMKKRFQFDITGL